MAIFFIFGIFAALFAAILELSVGVVFPAAGLLLSLSFFAFIEETMKLIMLRKTLDSRFRSPLIPKNVIFFAVGFIGVELSLATLRYPNMPAEAITGIAFVHTATVAWYGYALFRKFSSKLLLLALFMGIIAHLSYNLLLA